VSSLPGFRANEARLRLSLLANNLGNLWRRLLLLERIDAWSPTSLQQRLVKTGGRLARHARRAGSTPIAVAKLGARRRRIGAGSEKSITQQQAGFVPFWFRRCALLSLRYFGARMSSLRSPELA
jgi:hypothetical protein